MFLSYQYSAEKFLMRQKIVTLLTFFLLIAGLSLVKITNSTAATAAPNPKTATANQQIINQLIDILKSHESHKLRLQATIRLGNIDDPLTRKALIYALEKDPHYTVRAACATALAKLHEFNAIPQLLTRVGIDPEPFVRSQASQALEQFNHNEAIEYALKTYTSPYPSVRAEVIRFIASTPTPMIEPVLALALGDVAEVSTAASKAVMAIPIPARWRFLSSASSHPDVAVRRGAILALASMPSHDAAEIVLAVYDRDIEDEEVRVAAREALRRLRDFLPMSQVYRDANPTTKKHIRSRALRLLGCVGGPQALKILTEALKDNDRYVRGIAVMALGELDDPAALPAVEELLKHPDNKFIMHLINNTLRQLHNKQENREH
ncbi:MAG: HEAT repeat domain-containing protein [Deltaproteobacteria bacterium]|nr:HEAT repeat domain-containing protein [Deltaproteobacteria bacterium]